MNRDFLKGYIVRISGTHEPVGVFQAPSLYRLAILVDAAIRPTDCEYAVLPQGASMSLEGDGSSGNPWAQPIRKWTQLEGLDPVRLNWRPLQSQVHYEKPQQ